MQLTGATGGDDKPQTKVVSLASGGKGVGFDPLEWCGTSVLVA